MGLLQHFPNQHWSLCALLIDRSPWIMDGGLVVELVRNRILKYKKIKRKYFWLFNLFKNICLILFFLKK